MEEKLKSAVPDLSEDMLKTITTHFLRQNHHLLMENDTLREEIVKYKSNALSSASASALLPSNQNPLVSSSSNTRPKKRGGSENLTHVREFVKKTKGMSRLEYLVSLHGQYHDTSKLTEGARGFLNKAVIPVVKCLEKHHNNDKEKFLEQWPMTSALTTFRRKMCNCKGPVCGIS
jgi:regulator of replication initiation timing